MKGYASPLHGEVITNEFHAQNTSKILYITISYTHISENEEWKCLKLIQMEC